MSSVFALAAPGPNSSYTYGNATTNFRVVFGSSPQPFHIDVDPNFVANTQLKASLTRLTEDIDQPDWVDGPPRHNMSHIRDYWTNDFDWFDVQAHLNAKFKQFTTTVTAGPNYTYPIPLHFVHHRSPRKDAIPLLYIHSSPGSFLEVEDIIDPLTNPLNDALPAFHVVAPDIPGFGFSPSAQQVGLGLRETGQGFDNLMSQLGYKKYVVAGGDFGALTLRHMAPDFPDSIVSVLSTFYLVYPNATDLERFAKNQTSPMENANIAVTNNIITSNGYAAIQSTTPLQLAVGMTDSPVGTAAWIYNVMYQAAPGYFWTAKQIVTWAMLYYIQGPYGAFRTYKEATEVCSALCFALSLLITY